MFYNPSVVKCVFARHPALTSNHSKYSLYDATVEDWIIILKLADRWCFPEVKNLAVRELEKHLMDDIERIVVYQQYNVDKHLLIPRYAALCARTETLSLAEGIRLGMETALNIARARECARSPSIDGLRSPTSVALPAEEMRGLILDLFSISEASDSASKGQENGSSTASSSTTGGLVIPSCPYMLPHAHDGILQEIQEPRTPLTETPNQTERPQTATKTDEIVLSPVPAAEGDERTDEDSFDTDEDEESWDDVGSDSDTHVDNAGVDSEKVYGDVDDGPIENVVDPQENDDAHNFDEQLHDPAPDAGVGDGPPESSAQDSRDDNDASTSHEIDGGLDHGDGEADGKDASSASSSGEVENSGSTDITADTTPESAEGEEDDGGTPTGESPSDPTVDSSSSVPETRADASHGLGDDFSFDFVEPSGPGPIPTFDFDFDSDSTFDHIDILNITVHSPTASYAGTEAGDESIEASVNTEGRDQASEGFAKNASASSSSDPVPNASGPEGAMTTEADARVAEGSGVAAAEGNEDEAGEASKDDVPDHTLPASDETVAKPEDGGSVTASGDGSNAPADPPVPESEADEAALKPEEGSSTTAEGDNGNVPVALAPESSSDEAAPEPEPEHDGEQSTVPADADSALQHTADSTDEDAETDINVPSTADTTTSSSDPPATSSSPTLPPQPPVKDILEDHETGRSRRPTLTIDTNFSGTFVPTHAGHANGENGDQPADSRPVASVENPVEPPPVVHAEVPADLNPLGDAANPLPKATPPEESESEDDSNEEFYDSPEGPA